MRGERGALYVTGKQKSTKKRNLIFKKKLVKHLPIVQANLTFSKSL
jgi:hypothetical protein